MNVTRTLPFQNSIRHSGLKNTVPEWQTLWELYSFRVVYVIRTLPFQSGERYQNFTVPQWRTLWGLSCSTVANAMIIYAIIIAFATVEPFQRSERYDNFAVPEWRTLWELYRFRVANAMRTLLFQSGERYENFTVSEWRTLWELCCSRVANAMRTLPFQSGERYENFTAIARLLVKPIQHVWGKVTSFLPSLCKTKKSLTQG